MHISCNMHTYIYMTHIIHRRPIHTHTFRTALTTSDILCIHKLTSPQPPSNPALSGIENRSDTCEVDALHGVRFEIVCTVRTTVPACTQRDTHHSENHNHSKLATSVAPCSCTIH